MKLPNLGSTINGAVSNAVSSAVSNANGLLSQANSVVNSFDQYKNALASIGKDATGSLSNKEWAVYKEDGSLAFEFDVVISLSVDMDNPVMSEIAEKGAFTTYNKNITPTAISMQVIIQGDEARRQNAIQTFSNLSGSFDVLNIVTPDMEYPNYNLERASFEKKADSGLDLILFDLEFLEVRQVESKYGNAKLAPKKPKGKQNGPQSALSGLKDWLF